ncbi:MAG: peptidoglycan DD-metalloendopeptidase family protein [Saprospiraceae bacterium]|nr:peptidoglycan DD-metalloendopeptidase family protein [Saprospiraceae bacterium]
MRYGILMTLALLFFISISSSTWKRDIHIDHLNELPLPTKNLKFGFNLNDFHVTQAEIESNQFLADILIPHKVSYQAVAEIAENAKSVFSVRALRAGKSYYILNADTSDQADYFIYEPNAISYVVYDLRTRKAQLVEREITRVLKTASGTITSSLWQTMMNQNLDYELAAKLEDALAWSVDFHHIQKGDLFKAYYEELYVDDNRVGVGDLHAAYFRNSNNDYYALRYANEKYDGFYDLEGRPMKKVFLKSPVKYSRISSRYNLSRFHPVLRRVKAHLGTDYAAPYGTPIYAVANGVVTKASYTKGNGNYVKIRHDKTYETQYLHMQKIATGMSPGIQVKQGQVIGYVGSTGLATGPHVCFRFWKNGKQVNHLALNLPEPEPMAQEELPHYFVVRDKLKEVLDGIQFHEVEEIIPVPEEVEVAP